GDETEGHGLGADRGVLARHGLHQERASLVEVTGPHRKRGELASVRPRRASGCRTGRRTRCPPRKRDMLALPMVQDSGQQLTNRWNEVFGGWVEDLMREGHEAAILIPLAQRPTGAFRIIAHVRDWDNHMQRKIAATLAGHLGEKAPPSLLDELFQAETERDRRASQPLDRLLVQSVVEDIVFAATRWARTAGRKAPGVALLRKVVERTLSGQYWNTASYAMMGLAHHQADDWRNLLERFAAFANGARP